MVLALSFTFEHHPLTILHPERVPKRVIQEEVMDTVLDDLNVDYILRLPMNEELLQMSADEFFRCSLYGYECSSHRNR